jgi:L-iditol 2-dehydrogenase
MKQAVLVKPENIEIHETEQPEPAAGELLIRIAYTGVCTLEQRLYSGHRKIYYPIVPGHEAAGVIAAKGDQVFTHHQVGDHVALDLVNRCHNCSNCTTGYSNLCSNRFKKGQRVLGAFSEYMVVKPEQAFVIDENLPLRYAAFSEPLACCIRSLRKLNLSLGEDLLICGAGAMGLMHLKLAKAMGARVFVSDIDKQKLQTAKAMGADFIIDASDRQSQDSIIADATGGAGVNCCAITTSALASVETACMAMKDGGRMNIYTSYDDDPPFPMGLNSLHRKELQLTGSEGRTELDFRTSVTLLEKQIIRVDDLISEIVPIDDTDRAVQRAIAPETYRILVSMEQT